MIGWRNNKDRRNHFYFHTRKLETVFGITFIFILSKIGQVDCQKNATIHSQRVETVELPPQTMNLGPIWCDITSERLNIIEKSVEILLSRQISKNWDIQHYTHGQFQGMMIHITSFAQIHPIGNNHTKHNIRKKRENREEKKSVEIKNSHRKTKERLRNYHNSGAFLNATHSMKNRTGIFKFDLSGIAHFHENPPSSQFLSMLFEDIMKHDFIYLMEVIQEQEQEIIQNNENACFSALLLNIPSKDPKFTYRYIPETIQQDTVVEPEICKRRIHIAIFLYVVAAILACFLIFSKFIIKWYDNNLNRLADHGGKKIKNSAHGMDSTNLKILSGFDDEKVVFLSTNKFYDQTDEDQTNLEPTDRTQIEFNHNKVSKSDSHLTDKPSNSWTSDKEVFKSHQMVESMKSNLIRIIDDGVIKGEDNENNSHHCINNSRIANESGSSTKFNHSKSPTGDSTEERKYNEFKKQDDKNKTKKSQDNSIGSIPTKRVDNLKPSKLEINFDKVNLDDINLNAFIPQIPFTEEEIVKSEFVKKGRYSNDQTIGLALQDSMKDRLSPWSLLLIESQENDKKYFSEVMGGRLNVHNTENETRSEQPSTKAGLSTSSTEVPGWQNEMIKLPFDWDPQYRKKNSDPKLSSTAGDTMCETSSTVTGDSYHSKRFQIKSDSLRSHGLTKLDSASSFSMKQLLRRTNSKCDSDDDWKSVTAAERKKIRDAQDELFYTDGTQIDDSNQSWKSFK